jgi:hypothetical protein
LRTAQINHPRDLAATMASQAVARKVKTTTHEIDHFVLRDNKWKTEQIHQCVALRRHIIIIIRSLTPKVLRPRNLKIVGGL